MCWVGRRLRGGAGDALGSAWVVLCVGSGGDCGVVPGMDLVVHGLTMEDCSTDRELEIRLYLLICLSYVAICSATRLHCH